MEFLILASASAQRKSILEQMSLPFIIVPSYAEEVHISGDPVHDVQHIASCKVSSCLSRLKNRMIVKCEHVPPMTGSNMDFDEDGIESLAAELATSNHLWILGADTVIELDGRILEKPASVDEARMMLGALSAKEHRVLTGACLLKASIENSVSSKPTLVIDKPKLTTECDTTSVRFSKLSDDEIEWYLRSGEWRDAAGSYKIQQKGACLVESISGSYSNVVGLPIRRIYGMLLEQNFPLLC